MGMVLKLEWLSGMFCPNIQFCGFDLEVELQWDWMETTDDIFKQLEDTASCYIIVNLHLNNFTCRDVETKLFGTRHSILGKLHRK